MNVLLDSLGRLVAYLVDTLEVRYQKIITMQQILEERIMSIKTTVEAFAAQVNTFSNTLAASIENVRGDIADLKGRLVDATTEAEVDAILQPALANLGTVSAALEGLAAENEPTVPPVEPPADQPL
jgi:hypothetical protein